MKYGTFNKPMQCMMTQSTCYKGTRKMNVVGVLWHSTGANNPTLKRYVQPDDNASDRAALIAKIGKNAYNNDWNHIDREAGLNCWIGKLADGTVTTVQTMPWDYRPWGCGSGSNGSCNTGWIQFEICEDGLTDSTYFNAAYKEACEITAYLCKLYNIDPNGSVTVNGKKIPTILCHQDSYQLGMGGNHSDIYNWFPKHGKNMETARADVASLLKADGATVDKPAVELPAVNASVKENDVVKVAAGANYYTGKPVPSWVIATNWIVKEVAGDRAVIDKSEDGKNSICSPISTRYLSVVKSATTSTAPTDGVQKLYRVRKSKDDAKSQVGAYGVLDNAKEACNGAGVGYKVFDWNFEVVYEYKAPVPETPVQPTQPATPSEQEKPKEEPKVIAVYDLDFPEKNLIVDASISRTEKDCVKAIKKIRSNNSGFNVEIAKAFCKLAPKYKIDPIMAISQSILETGWFKYAGSSVKPEQNNYCGLGATGNGAEGNKFDSVEAGATAQLQHLFAYGSKDELSETIIDPRFKYVTRGIASYWQQLAGRWACPGYDNKTYDTPEKAMAANNTYGQKIRIIYNQLMGVTVSDSDIEEYFPKEQPAPTETESPTPEVPPVVESDDQKTNKIVDIIIQVIKKLFESLAEIFRKGTK
jgi:flagellum-specific peptidoglycan hydrolase FlgJ